MKSYYVWLTALSKVYEQTLCCALLNKGYTMSAAGNNGKVNTDNLNSAALFALKVSKEEATQYSIYTDVLNILEGINAYYYSLIIVEASEAIPLWLSTNISFDYTMPNIIQTKKTELN